MSANNTFIYTWKIKNFSFNTCDANKSLVSPNFYAVPLCGTIWSLHLFPRGHRTPSGYVACFLHRSDVSGPRNIKIRFDFSLVGKDGASHLPWQSQFQTFKRGKLSGFGNNRLWNTSQLLKGKDIYLPDDVLTVKCSLTLVYNAALYSSTAETVIECEKISFRRNIEDMSEFKNPGHRVSVKLHFLDSFEMVVISEEDDTQNLFSCIRREQKSATKSYLMKGKVSLLDSGGKTAASIEGEYFFQDPDSEWKFSFINLKKLQKEKVLVDDTLELLFELSLSDGEPTSETNIAPEALLLKENDENIADLFKWRDDWKTVVTDEEFCDVTLRCGDKMLKAHRVILAARSPVFRAEFLRDFLEKKNGIVDINDVDSATIDHLFNYMYYGKFNLNSMEEMVSLLSVAERYHLWSLKDHHLSSVLEKSITLSNVCAILVLSDRYNLQEVKKRALKLIVLHSAEVLASEDWIRLIQANVQLELEVRRELQKKS